MLLSIFSKERFGETHILSEIDHADQTGDILKHPICESVLHLKWLLIRKVLTAKTFNVIFFIENKHY